jgi:hypothetical protein
MATMAIYWTKPGRLGCWGEGVVACGGGGSGGVGEGEGEGEDRG